MYTNRILIKSEREYLREVFSRIENGKYAVPSFQRDFVWTDKQILELFDSIIKGYPIGSITLWHSEDLYRRKDILTDKDSENSQPDYYILDGRQRLTALYGCCTGVNSYVDKRFSVSYDLFEDKLLFSKGDDSLWIVPIYEIYNTFKMLGRLRLLQNSDLEEDQIHSCGERLMHINTILQEYVISEILIENCSLQEAGEVFARINSKGTGINRMEMLQAVALKSPSGILISREINKIKRKLEPFGFQDLDSKTILNCFFKFAGLTFYENSAIDLAQFNFEDNMTEITSCICRTAAFLHNECFVLSSKLLPYSRQFIALSSFFKEVVSPTEKQIDDLKQWFYYTTACQSFMNGSLSNVRAIFNKFESYVSGECNEAGTYERIRLPGSFGFRVSSKSALSNLLMLTQVRKRVLSASKLIGVKKVSYYKLFSHPAAYFPLLSDKDKTLIKKELSQLDKSFFDSANKMEEFFLNEKLIQLYQQGDLNGFNLERTNILLEGEKELLESCGLSVEII